MKRVWNIVNPSIYSLSSFNNEGEQNFNICSYVSVVSLKPKLYMIAIEKTSKTHSNLLKSSSCVLQILSTDNINLVKSLGKKSGCSSGNGGSMHLVDKSKNFIGTTAIVSSSIPVGVGYAEAFKLKKKNLE